MCECECQRKGGGMNNKQWCARHSGSKRRCPSTCAEAAAPRQRGLRGASTAASPRRGPCAAGAHSPSAQQGLHCACEALRERKKKRKQSNTERCERKKKPQNTKRHRKHSLSMHTQTDAMRRTQRDVHTETFPCLHNTYTDDQGHQMKTGILREKHNKTRMRKVH